MQKRSELALKNAAAVMGVDQEELALVFQEGRRRWSTSRATGSFTNPRRGSGPASFCRGEVEIVRGLHGASLTGWWSCSPAPSSPKAPAGRSAPLQQRRDPPGCRGLADPNARSWPSFREKKPESLLPHRGPGGPEDRRASPRPDAARLRKRRLRSAACGGSTTPWANASCPMPPTTGSRPPAPWRTSRSRGSLCATSGISSTPWRWSKRPPPWRTAEAGGADEGQDEGHLRRLRRDPGRAGCTTSSWSTCSRAGRAPPPT